MDIKLEANLERTRGNFTSPLAELELRTSLKALGSIKYKYKYKYVLPWLFIPGQFFSRELLNLLFVTPLEPKLFYHQIVYPNHLQFVTLLEPKLFYHQIVYPAPLLFVTLLEPKLF